MSKRQRVTNTFYVKDKNGKKKKRVTFLSRR